MRHGCHADLSWIKTTVALTSLSHFKGQGCFLVHYATPTHPPPPGDQGKTSIRFPGWQQIMVNVFKMIFFQTTRSNSKTFFKSKE